MPSTAAQPPDRAPVVSLHERLLSAWFIVPLQCLVIIASRIGPILLGAELNPDESQMMAQVMRLKLHAIPWRGMDGTTSGPLNTWALSLAHAVGVPLDYHWIHFLAAAILAATCALTYATLRVLCDRTIAAWGAAASTMTLVLGVNCPYYSSELLPALLAATALLCIAVSLTRPRLRAFTDLACAAAVGVLPWTKLQAVIGAVAIGAWLLWRMSRPLVRDPAPANVRRNVLRAVGVVVLPSALLLAVIIAGGAWTDFWSSYVLSNLTYAGRLNPVGIVRRGLTLLWTPPGYELTGVLLFTAAWWRFGRTGWGAATAPLRAFLGIVAVFTGATLLAVLTPRSFHSHFAVLLVQPLALLAACLLATARVPAHVGADERVAVGAFALLVLGVPLICVPATFANVRGTLAACQSVAMTPDARIAATLRSIAPGGARLVVWGWMPALYVRTGMAPATRHAVCHFVIDPGPGREHLRASFLEDVRTERPEVIVDAIAAGCFRWGWDSTRRLDSYPELSEFVHENYDLVADVSLDEVVVLVHELGQQIGRAHV